MQSLLLLPIWTFLLQAQAPAQQPVPTSDTLPVSLERIRRELQTSEVTIQSADRVSSPLIRVEVVDRYLRYEDLWKEQTLTPSFVRPSRGLVHHEFLEQVTPDLFRGTAMHPCCYDALSLLGLAKKGIVRLKRSIDEERARKEVRESLAEFMREKPKPEKQDR